MLIDAYSPEDVFRLLIVKHLYNWYSESEESVADSLVLRWFCRIYFRAVPDFSIVQR